VATAYPTLTEARATALRIALTDPRDPGWDEFVRAHPRTTPYHLSAYAEILRRAYRVRPVYLAAHDGDGLLRGVLPLVEARGRLVSERRLNSLSFVRTAGPLGLERADEVELLRAALAFTRGRGIPRLTVRSTVAGFEDDVQELAVEPSTPSWRLELPRDPDELRAAWRKGSKNLHRNLAKAEKGPVRVHERASRADVLAFYRLYLATMQRHGAVPHSPAEFLLARRLLGPAGVHRLLVAEHDGAMVAGAVFYVHGGTIELLYNASDERHRDLRPNHAIYWHAIRWAIAQGLSGFEFGSASLGTGLADFKAQWGAVAVPVSMYSFRAGGAGAVVDRLVGAHDAVQDESPSLMGRAWRSTPLPLTALAGHLASRWL
jgi:hypothetical protein